MRSVFSQFARAAIGRPYIKDMVGFRLAVLTLVKNGLKKLFQNITQYFLSFLLTFTSMPVFAGDIEAKIGQAAIDAYIKTSSVEALNSYFNNTYSIPKGAALENVASKVFSIIEVGVSLDNLSKAENDKSRFYAALRTVAGAINYVNPAVGLSMQISILVVSLFEANLSIGHQKRMIEIMIQIKEYQQKIAVSQDKLIQADRIRLENDFKKMQYAHSQAQITQKTLTEICSDVKSSSDYSSLDLCLRAAQLLLTHQEQFVDSIKSILSFYSIHLDLDKILTSFQISKESLQSEINTTQSTIANIKVVVKEMIIAVSSALARFIIKSAEDQALLSTKERFFSYCIQDINEVKKADILLSLARIKLRNNNISKETLQKTLDLRIDAADKIETKQCFELININSDRHGLYETILKTEKPFFRQLILEIEQEGNN